MIGYGPPGSQGLPPGRSGRPTPWEAEEARHRRTPLIAIPGLACALAGLWLLYFGKSVVPLAVILGVAAIVLSSAGWRYASASKRHAGLAIVGLVLGVAVATIAVLLSL